MNKRQEKKTRKKVTYPLVDEMNLLTLSEEEYKQAMADFEEYVQKYCRYKHYRDRFKVVESKSYSFPVGKEYKECIDSLLKITAKKVCKDCFVDDVLYKSTE